MDRPHRSGGGLCPGVQVTIDDGFAGDEIFAPANLEAMEQRMREIVARNGPIALEF